MIASMWIATALLAAAVTMSIVRIFTATDAATRAAAGDVIFFSCVGILIIQGMLRGSAVSVDLSMLAAMLGILTTIALARIVTRGRR